MLNWKIALITGMLAVTILPIIGYVQGLNAASECKFAPRSLVGASWDEINKAALDFICAKYETFGVAPEIRMSRFVTTSELASMFDEGRSDVGCPDQQLALIILKGDFRPKSGAFPGYVDFSKLPHTKYEALVFDLRIGIPTRIVGSPHGEKFRTVLNDPTIPTAAPAPTQPATGPKPVAAPTLPYPKGGPQCGYGTIAPTVMPPTASRLPPSTPTRPSYP